MITLLFSRMAILGFGTLYPAYASFKAIRGKEAQDYVTWMMYWIVFALFSCMETVTDIFLPWLPFYYELKVLLVLWLLPTTFNGGALLYRNVVHPQLKRREQLIDAQVVRVKEQGYATLREWCACALQHAHNATIQIVQRGMQLVGQAQRHQQQQEQRPLVNLERASNIVITELNEDEQLAVLEPPLQASKSVDLFGKSSQRSLGGDGVKKTASKTKTVPPRASSRSRSRKPRTDFDVNLNEEL